MLRTDKEAILFVLDNTEVGAPIILEMIERDYLIKLIEADLNGD